MDKRTGELVCSRFRVPYRVYGDSDKIIVCISGAKQTMSAWHSFVRRFKKDFSVLVFDLPGQGRSEILSADANVTLEEQVDVVLRLSKELNLAQYQQRFLIGGSWGSIVAAGVAAQVPCLFDKAVLGSFGTKPNSVLDGIIDTVQECIEQGRGSEIAALMIESFGQYIPPSLKRQMIKQFEEMSEAQFMAFYEHSRSVRKMGDLKDHIDLSNIKIPVLVIMGQFDTIMDMFDAKNAAEMMADACFKIVPKAGHFLHWEQASIMDEYQDFFMGEREKKISGVA